MLHVELRKVQCTSAMTWEAVQALLAARGAAALLLHSSLDNQVGGRVMLPCMHKQAWAAARVDAGQRTAARGMGAHRC